MNRLNNRRTSYIFLVIGTILALVAFVLTTLLDPLKFSEQSSLASIPAFFLSVIILVISHIFAVSKEIEKTTVDSDKVQEAVKNYLHIIRIGTPKKAWEYIMERLPALEYVQNTSFDFEEENEISSERLYNSTAYQNSADKIACQIENGLKWKDIGDSVGLERFQKITSYIKGKKHSNNYVFKLIDHAVPQMNFILLTYKDGITEVLFNWDFREIPHDPIVLLSREREMFNLFAAHFKVMWRVAVSDYDSIATKSTSEI